MYFIPYALLVETDEAWVSATSGVPTLGLTWSAFVWDSLLPVTIGNVIGGAVMVGAVYWFVYLRRRA
jgi:formate/nitrite transporter FocA (FNT family)